MNRLSYISRFDGYAFRLTVVFETGRWFVREHEEGAPDENWYGHMYSITLPYDTDASQFAEWMDTTKPLLARVSAGYDECLDGETGDGVLNDDARLALKEFLSLFGDQNGRHSVPALGVAVANRAYRVMRPVFKWDEDLITPTEEERSRELARSREYGA